MIFHSPVPGSLFLPFLFTAALLTSIQANTTYLSLGQPPLSPCLSNFCPSSRQHGQLSAFCCPVLSFSLPWPCSHGWRVQWNRQGLYCARASVWEHRVRPEVSGNACLCQDTKSHSDHARGVISFRTKGKAG